MNKFLSPAISILLAFVSVGPAADTLAGLTTHDSINKTDTVGQAQYQSTLPVMRRDVSQGINGGNASAKPQREKFVASKDTAKPPVRKDSILVVSNKTKESPPAGPQLKKSGLYLALGVCALIGCGIAAYVIKSAPGNGSGAANTGIPPPPVPPANFAPSP